jgi:hypothetical protein
VMSVFQATLRSRVEQVQEAIVDARQAGHDSMGPSSIADVVIDLLGAMPAGADGAGSGPAVITPDHERDTALALPGLVRAILRTPGATRHRGPPRLRARARHGQ